MHLKDSTVTSNICTLNIHTHTHSYVHNTIVEIHKNGKVESSIFTKTQSQDRTDIAARKHAQLKKRQNTITLQATQMTKDKQQTRIH